MGEFPSGQRGQTVNLLCIHFGGPNPPSPIRKKHLRKQVLFSMMFAKVRFANFSANDVGYANDVRFANDVCLTAHGGKHHITATGGSNIILSEAKTSYRRRRCIIYDIKGCALIYP